jgi:Thioredoxin-like domain
MKIFLILTVLLATPVLSLALPAQAQTVADLEAGQGAPTAAGGEKIPDISTIPALKQSVDFGAQFYYMGKRYGLHGWFVVKDYQVQMIYLTPDQRAVILGAIFDSVGNNVTAQQVNELTESNPALKNKLDTAIQHDELIEKAGATGGAAVVPAMNNTGPISNLPSTALSPGEQLIQELQAAAGVNMGAADKPMLYMVVDVNCPHCKATWKEMRDTVAENRIQVRLVPVATEGSDSEKQGAELLRTSEPYKNWDAHVNGDKKVLGDKPDDLRIRAMRNNLYLTQKWKINSTPYLVYRAKDGRIKVVVGKPERIAAVLSDLIPGDATK